MSPNENNAGNGSFTSPIGSLARLQVVLSKLAKSGTQDIEVIFQKGIYPVSKTFVIDFETIGKANISFKAKEGDTVIWSSGKEITGWQKVNKKLLAAPAEGIYTEQLYVNGSRATRARTPNAKTKRPFFYPEKINFKGNERGAPTEVEVSSFYKMPKLNPGEEAELVIMKDWSTMRKQVAATHPRKGKVWLKEPFPVFPHGQGAHNTITSPERVPGFGFYLEGALSMLDKPGEWALHNNMIYYMPARDESIKSVMVPLADTLLLISGNTKEFVKNIHFEGITFAHTGYKLPPKGYDGNQAACFYNAEQGKEDPGWLGSAVVMRYARNCSFSRCTFSELGANALRINKGCRNVTIDSCRFSHVGANGIVAGTIYDHLKDTVSQVRNIVLKRNSISTAGQHFSSGVGIWLGFAAECEISHNEIFDLPYTGISVGWQWNPEPTSSANNKINFNHVHHVMQELGDGGGIYLLGLQPGSEIVGNTIHNVLRSKHNHASPNNGLFFDEGAKGYRAANNVIYKTSHSPIRGHKACGITLENNILIFDKHPPVYHTPPYDKAIEIYENGQYQWRPPANLEGYRYPAEVPAFHLINNKMIRKKDWEAPAP